MEVFWEAQKVPVADYLKDTPEFVEKAKAMKMPQNYIIDRLLTAEMNTDSASRDSVWQQQWAEYSDYAAQALNKAAENLTSWEDSTGLACNWKNYKNTSVEHLIPGLHAFSEKEIAIDGNYNCVNATQDRWGPSWRMVVALDPKGPKAYGVYPGGQDGNPFSIHYKEMIPEWANGEYFELHLLDPDDMDSPFITSTLTVNPK